MLRKHLLANLRKKKTSASPNAAKHPKSVATNPAPAAAARNTRTAAAAPRKRQDKPIHLKREAPLECGDHSPLSTALSRCRRSNPKKHCRLWRQPNEPAS